MRCTRSLIAPLLLFAATIALYARSLTNGLTNWDDPRYVTQNPFASRGLAGIPAAFTSGWDDVWYPLTHSVYCVIQAVTGPSAFAHHLVQIVLAALAVALLPAALATFGLRRPLACCAALLWILHPMRVESISWASSLKDVLSLLGLVLAFLAFGRGRRRVAALAFTAALLAKTTVFPMALLFIWLDAFQRSPRNPWASLRATLPFWAPAIACTLVTARLHAFSGHTGMREVIGGSLLAAIPSSLWLPWWYVGRSLSVAPPQTVYAFEPVGWMDVRLLAALLLWALTLAIVWRLRAVSPRIRGAAFLGFALPFAPVTGLVPLAFPLADRFALLPSIALVSLLVVTVDASIQRGARSAPDWTRRAAGVALLAATVAVLVPPNLARQADWKDSISLWKPELQRAPTVAAVYINLAGAYGGEDRWAEAIATLRELQRRGLPYPNLARDLFFAHAALDGMDPALVLELSASIEKSQGAPSAIRAAAAAAKAAGHTVVADAVADLAATLSSD